MQQTLFGRQLKHPRMGNPLVIHSGLRQEEIPKEFKVRSIPFVILFPVLTRTYHYRRSMYTTPDPPYILRDLAIRTLQNLLKMVLLAGLSKLYDSHTTSLKALICHVAMKRERSSSWRGEGESVRRRCMRCEGVLTTYRLLRWDANAIRRVAHTFASDSTTTFLLKTASFSPHPNLPFVHRLLPVGCRPLTRSG